jgi:DNA-binding LytR/AlgR family response regulator
MKILVVDDEAPARARLVRLLNGLSDVMPGVVVVGEAATGRDALTAVEALAPDLLLLDVEMPELDGLRVAAECLPPVIFVTAYDRHAVPAFDVDAVDYLLKPVRRERLLQALERAARRLPSPAATATGDGAVPRIVAMDRGTTRIFDARKLTRLWASEKYTVFVGDGEECLTAEPLSTLEERLAPHGFVRVHRGELVRLSAVRGLRQQNGTVEVELEDGQFARVSRRSVSTLKAELGLP